jgi:hypothetical protein
VADKCHSGSNVGFDVIDPIRISHGFVVTGELDRCRSHNVARIAPRPNSAFSTASQAPFEDVGSTMSWSVWHQPIGVLGEEICILFTGAEPVCVLSQPDDHVADRPLVCRLLSRITS